jgi:hypothetical protein
LHRARQGWVLRPPLRETLQALDVFKKKQLGSRAFSHISELQMQVG